MAAQALDAIDASNASAIGEVVLVWLVSAKYWQNLGVVFVVLVW